MKLTVDCVLSHSLLNLASNSALVKLIAAAKRTPQDTPLEALLAKQYGLDAKPDFALAAIAAAADGIAVDAAYWLRADPVHLILQRDSFSLGEPVPLVVDAAHAQQMIASLNLHFEPDGLKFFIGASGAWYLRSLQALALSTSLPSQVVGRNVHTYLPQGADAAKFRSVFNEIQMLLFEHPANAAHEGAGRLAVNSIWFSGGGKLPDTRPTGATSNAPLVYADSALYHGLAGLSGSASHKHPQQLEQLFQHPSGSLHVRLALGEQYTVDDSWFASMLLALQQKNIRQLTLNLGFYDKTLTAEIQYADLVKSKLLFWRQVKPVLQYLS